MSCEGFLFPNFCSTSRRTTETDDLFYDIFLKEVETTLPDIIKEEWLKTRHFDLVTEDLGVENKIFSRMRTELTVGLSHKF